MRKTKRKMVVHLIEKNEVYNLRVISAIIAEKIKNGGLQL
jgi:hypothetical protein